ncbi:MAG TPA: pseudouridine synthase [Terriglobales bacterium]|jgi:23S rRNA pseudouridine2605 synthase|nr:pseudouridine synthase [Terriglobales bacterium]
MTLRKIGLARVLSKQGYCSRSRASELIRGGKVTVNGALRRDPEYPVRIERDSIEVEGQKIASEEKIYWMLNKPRGLVTTSSDEMGRDTVYAILPPGLPWLGPVGRLDKASEGLLLLTNDSEWAAKITAPETHLAKTYHVQVKELVSDANLEAIRKGIKTEEGEVLSVKEISVIRSGERNAWMQITLDEGKNRHIRRMLSAIEIEVLRLVRITVGPLRLGDLAKGGSRELTAREKKEIDRAIS